MMLLFVESDARVVLRHTTNQLQRILFTLRASHSCCNRSVCTLQRRACTAPRRQGATAKVSWKQLGAGITLINLSVQQDHTRT